MHEIYDDILAAGVEVYLVGLETDEGAVQMMEKTNARIPILTDVDGAVISSYGLGFVPPENMQDAYRRMGHPILEANAQTGFMLPIPATYVLDQGGIVRERYINADYTHRMEPSEVLAAVRAVAER